MVASEPFRLTWQLGQTPQLGYAESTLRVVRALALRDSRTPEIRLLAQELSREQIPYDNLGEATALQHYVRDSIRYVRDVLGVETVQSPRLTLRIGSGDCDDKTALLASLLYSIGFPVRYVLAATSSRHRAHYTHIYPEAQIRGQWVALETISPGAEPGYRVRSFATKREA